MKTGDAKRWKEQYLKSRKDAVDATHPFCLAPNNRYEDFEDELRKSFKDPYRKENALLVLQKICQGKRTIDQHNIDFKLLVDKAQLDPLMNAEVLTPILSTQRSERRSCWLTHHLSH